MQFASTKAHGVMPYNAIMPAIAAVLGKLNINANN